MLPEWLPNVHPLIVHFPIALLVIAVLVDMVTSLSKRLSSLSSMPLVLYTIGSVSAVVTYFTGKYAADDVYLPTEAISAVNEHSDLALYTVLGFGIYTLIRLFISYRSREISRWVRLILVAIPLAGLLLLAETAEHGAKLVYKYGIGIGESEMEHADTAEPGDTAGQDEEHEHSDTPSETAGQDEEHEHSGTSSEASMVEVVRMERHDDGSFSWTPGSGAEVIFQRSFYFLRGMPTDIAVVSTDSGAVFQMTGEELFFVTDDSLENIEVIARLDASDFNGSLSLVHNVITSDTYDFVRIGGGRLEHGRMLSGTEKMFDTSDVDLSTVSEIRSVSTDTHFRAYINGDLAAHGHGDAAEAGGIGFILDGEGTIRLMSLGVTKIQ